MLQILHSNEFTAFEMPRNGLQNLGRFETDTLLKSECIAACERDDSLCCVVCTTESQIVLTASMYSVPR